MPPARRRAGANDERAPRNGEGVDALYAPDPLDAAGLDSSELGLRPAAPGPAWLESGWVRFAAVLLFAALFVWGASSRRGAIHAGDSEADTLATAMAAVHIERSAGPVPAADGAIPDFAAALRAGARLGTLDFTPRPPDGFERAPLRLGAARALELTGRPALALPFADAAHRRFTLFALAWDDALRGVPGRERTPAPDIEVRFWREQDLLFGLASAGATEARRR